MPLLLWSETPHLFASNFEEGAVCDVDHGLDLLRDHILSTLVELMPNATRQALEIAGAKNERSAPATLKTGVGKRRCCNPRSGSGPTRPPPSNAASIGNSKSTMPERN